MRYFLLAALLLAADPRPVHAGSCHGGGGGGTSSSGSGGDGSRSSSSGGGSSNDTSWSYASTSSGAYATSSQCIDDTDVHGFRHCTRFGAWGKNMRMPKLFLELGSNVRNFGSSLADRTGSISHGLESFAYRVVMPGTDAPRDVAVTSTLRLGFGIPRGFYSGVEFELGALVSPAAATAEMTSAGAFGTPNVEQQHGMFLGFTGVGGYRAVGSRGSIAIEGAGGLRSVRYNFDSSYHYCQTTTTVTANMGVVEARARAELWLSPWLTAGVTVGSNVLERSDWLAGVYIGAHSRAFGGAR